MSVDPEALLAELRALRRGRSTRHPAFPSMLGACVRELCGVTDTDTGPTARAKLVDVFRVILDGESNDVWLSVLSALALHRETDQRALAARERWLAQRLHCHERTARRRVDEAFAILGRKAAQFTSGGAVVEERWRVRRIRALVRLDGPVPEITEHRTITMNADGVDEIVCRFTVPRPDPNAEHDLALEVLHGGKVRERDRPAPEHFRYFIQLPRAFDAGEVHEYSIRLSLPGGQTMLPHYVMQPLLPVRAFDVNVRFHPNRLPTHIWRLDGVPPRMIDGGHDGAQRLCLDRFGEVHLSFENLRQGFAYGLSWAGGPE